MIVLGLTGAAGAGKDTVAEYLAEEHGFTRLAFADDLKDMLNTLNPVIAPSIRLMDVRREAAPYAEPVLKRHFPEYRRLLQVLGTDCVRARESNFWIAQLIAKANKLPDDAKIVVTDCRFPNEVTALTRWANNEDSIAFWEVVRPGLPTPPGNVHSSESWAGRMGEATLDNSGTLPQLHAKVEILLAKLMQQPAMVGHG